MPGNTKGFDQVDRRRYSEQVVESIKTEILSNRVAVGDKLPGEQELTHHFNISRTVVREAIRVLEESGLVEIRKGPKGGIFVTHSFHKPMSISLKSLIDHGQTTIGDLFQVRALIEPHAAFEAAKNASPKDLQALHALIDDSFSHLDDPLLLKANNIRFHLLLAKAAGNPVLSLLMESVVELVTEFAKDFSDHPFGRQSVRTHKKLLSLIETGRADEAKRLISREIEGVRNRLENFLPRQQRRMLSSRHTGMSGY